MEVILKKDVEHLGRKDDLVSVKPGYGRNYLVPQGFAVLVTPSLKKMHNETLKQRAHKNAKLKEEAESLVSKLQKSKLTIGTKVGEKGKIFGSIGTIQVAEAIEKAGFSIDRRDIKIKDEPIKQIGVYKADVRFHKEVTATVEFEVVGE